MQPPATTPVVPGRRLPAVLVAVVVAAALSAGVLARIWLLGRDALNSDEAVVGLVARGIQHGHLTAFVWGQPYGGVEPYVVAGVFGVLGPSALAVNLTPALLAAAVAVATWRVGRHLLAPWAAAAAAALAWIWPESTVFNSTREYGYHEAALLAGMVVLLSAVRIAEGGREGADRIGDWAVAGLAAGVGWWASPEVVYFLVPCAVLLAGALVRRTPWAVGGRVSLAVAGCGAGMVPWLVAGAGDGWAVLRADRATAQSGTYLHRLEIFGQHVLPMLLGLQVEGAGRWEGGPAAGHMLYGAAVAGIVVALVVLWRRVPAARVLVGYCLAFPLLYAVFPTSWFWNDGRYGIALTPVLALVVVGALSTVGRVADASPAPGVPEGAPRPARRAPFPAGLLVCGVLALAAVTTVAAVDMTVGLPGVSSAPPVWRTQPDPAVSAVASRLQRLRVHDVYAGYWLAYDVEFLSGGQVTTVAVGDDRDPAQARQVARSARAAWVFVAGTARRYTEAVNQLGTAGDLEPIGVSRPLLVSWLRAHRVRYTTVDSGPFVVVLPAHTVTPAQLRSAGQELSRSATSLASRRSRRTASGRSAASSS